MDLNPADLRRVDVFENATDEDLEIVASNSLQRAVEDGGFFFFQGDPAAYAYILLSGRAKLLQTTPAGQQVNLRTIQPWQIFGALGAVRNPAKYPATAQALEESIALAIESAYLNQLIQTRPYLSFGLMHQMTEYIQEIQERYRELATEKVERRIARALLRLTSQMGVKENGGIELPFTRQELAEMSGTTLYTVSRILAEWERQGLVGAGRERVILRDPHSLVKIAEELEK